MINIGLIGFGVVNSGVYEIFEEQRAKIEKAIGDEFKISKILVKNKKNHKNIENLLAHDISELVDDENIDLIIEATGKVDEIIGDIKKILENKNLISSNKALISKYFEDLLEISKTSKKKLKFDSAVGGAIPIIENLYKIKTLNDVEEIKGIFNGSCNFILSKMEEGDDFNSALKKAQELGFAESDPTDDIDGLDSMRKLRIVSTILFEKEIKEEDISLEGIRNIRKKDIEKAKKNGKKYKLIAYANCKGVYKVRPELVDENSNFGLIKDNENIFQIKTSNAKNLIFQGAGAGKRETAFSVLNDFLEIYGKI